MVQPSRAGWWVLLVTALFIVAAWPPERDKSLLIKLTNWTVDPAGRLPVLPPQLTYGMGDDVEAVEARDAQVRLYDRLSAEGGWTRARLSLKVANDPFNRSTERQFLLAFGVIVTFAVWRTTSR